MNPLPVLDQRIASIVDYLHEQQQPDGEFPILRRFQREVGSYVKPTKYEGWYDFGKCPFATANIAYHLRWFNHPKIVEVRTKACQFLLQVMENGVARYVPACHKPVDFPTDVDDTCLAVAALLANGRQPYFNQSMVLANRDGCGNFYTWLIPRWRHLANPLNFAWLVRDARVCDARMKSYGTTADRLQQIHREYRESRGEPAIAANVLLCTRITRSTQPFLDAMIARIQREDIPLKNYAHPLVPYFHIARLYQSGVDQLRCVKDKAVARILDMQQADGSVDGPFNSAIAALTLIYFGCWDERALFRILALLLRDEMHETGWVPFHYCNDLDGVFVDGCAELTAAFYLEAFLHYREHLCNQQQLEARPP